MVSASASMADEHGRTFSKVLDGDLHDVRKNDAVEDSKASPGKVFAVDEQTFMLAVEECQIFRSEEFAIKVVDESPSKSCSSSPSVHDSGDTILSSMDDRNILEEFMEEIQLLMEEKFHEEHNPYLESPALAMDSEERFLTTNYSSEIRAPQQESEKDSEEDLVYLSKIDYTSSSISNPLDLLEESPKTETLLSNCNVDAPLLNCVHEIIIQAQSGADEPENPSNDEVQGIFTIIGNEQSDERRNKPLEDERTLEEDKTYSVFKFLGHEEEESQLSFVDQNAAITQESQLNGEEESQLSRVDQNVDVAQESQLNEAEETQLSCVDQNADVTRESQLNEAKENPLSCIDQNADVTQESQLNEADESQLSGVDQNAHVTQESELNEAEESQLSCLDQNADVTEESHLNEADEIQLSGVDQNADVTQASQRSEFNVITSPTNPPNFISLEAWIDEISDESELDGREEKENQNAEIHQFVVDKEVESSGQRFNSEELGVDQDCQSQTCNITERALSPRPCDLDLSEEPREGKDGRQETVLSSNVSDSTQLQSPDKRPLSVDLTCSEISEHLEREREILPCAKQHTPLKSLLMQANHETTQEALNLNLTLTLNPLNRQLTQSPFLRQEARKEWNSPARLPVPHPARADRRKIKARPQWVPFLCCPSLN